MLITQMELAGAQKAMFELANGLNKYGYKIILVTMYDKKKYLHYFEKRYGITITNLNMKSTVETNIFIKGRNFIRGLIQMYNLLRNCNPQVIQTFSLYSNIIGAVIAWLANVPIRVTSQRASLKGYPKWLLWLDRSVENSFLVHKMVAVSDGTRRYSISEGGINSNKLITIQNGIDIDQYSKDLSFKDRSVLQKELQLDTDSMVVLTVARFQPQKGHKYLVEAIPKIVREFPRTIFLFVGEGELTEEIKLQVERSKLTNYIRFLGVRRDIPKLLAFSDIFVLPSLWEGMPNSILEAMSAGVPVIASNVDGIPEIIRDGENGLLVPPADSFALGNAIRRLLKDEGLCKSFAEVAKLKVEQKFHRNLNTKLFVNLYEVLISKQFK